MGLLKGVRVYKIDARAAARMQSTSNERRRWNSKEIKMCPVESLGRPH